MIFRLDLRYVALCATFIVSLCTITGLALAQSADNKLPPPDAPIVLIDSNLSDEEETHPPIRLTGDKSHILNLDEAVERVIIGNDAHINILMDTSKRLVIVPRLAGATHFALLGENGKMLMQRHVIVSGPEEKYVRVRKTCRELERCMPIRMFYCPDMCHEIAVQAADGTAISGSIPDAAGKGGDDEGTGLIPTDMLDAISGGDEQ